MIKASTSAAAAIAVTSRSHSANTAARKVTVSAGMSMFLSVVRLKSPEAAGKLLPEPSICLFSQWPIEQGSGPPPI